MGCSKGAAVDGLDAQNSVHAFFCDDGAVTNDIALKDKPRCVVASHDSHPSLWGLSKGDGVERDIIELKHGFIGPAGGGFIDAARDSDVSKFSPLPSFGADLNDDLAAKVHHSTSLISTIKLSSSSGSGSSSGWMKISWRSPPRSSFE